MIKSSRFPPILRVTALALRGETGLPVIGEAGPLEILLVAGKARLFSLGRFARARVASRSPGEEANPDNHQAACH